jgi:hypothetical protein
MPCSKGSMPRPDHHQWRRMSILELIIPIRWKFPHPGILALGIPRQVWGSSWN